jgi:quercetin dioxygenase-like cupin family protein
MMDGILQGPGEGESLFGGRIVLKSGLEQLTVTESWFATARQGATPHYHRQHTDSFYVLEGELAIRVGDEEHLVGPGGTVSAPPGFVHGFRSTMPTRFLNFHTPDARFADHLRELDRGEAGGFDSVDVTAAADGPTDCGAVLLHGGEGEALEANNRVATIKIGTDDLCVIEFELEPTHEGPDAHSHTDHTDSFYVLEGSVNFQLGDRHVLAGPGSFVAAPPGVTHAFMVGPTGARMLNVHAPSVGFHDRLRGMG